MFFSIFSQEYFQLTIHTHWYCTMMYIGLLLTCMWFFFLISNQSSKFKNRGKCRIYMKPLNLLDFRKVTEKVTHSNECSCAVCLKYVPTLFHSSLEEKKLRILSEFVCFDQRNFFPSNAHQFFVAIFYSHIHVVRMSCCDVNKFKPTALHLKSK